MDKKDENENRFFNVEMPKWYTVCASLFRGVCLGFIFGVLFMKFMFRVENIMIPVIAILVAAFLAALPSLPKAWIEQRNRLRGLKDGTMKEYIELRKKGGSS